MEADLASIFFFPSASFRNIGVMVIVYFVPLVNPPNPAVLSLMLFLSKLIPLPGGDIVISNS